jgi:nitrite reductase/ring-hydroxylating ferredoxin subunit
VEPAAGALTASGSAHVRTVDIHDMPGTTWLPTDRPSAVARAGVRSGVVVAIADDEIVDDPIVVDLRGTAAVSYGYLDVRAGRNSTATVVLVHDASIDVSGVILTAVAEGARLTMLSIIDGPAEHTQLWHWHTTVARDATFVGAVATLGGRIVRILPSVEFTGSGASAELLGAFLADGDQYLEHRLFVEHDLPHCTSNVIYKGALSGEGAHTVWIGDVLVRPTAVGTSTYEMNRNLLLNDGPRADSVPNLELETGDIVSAAHGASAGRARILRRRAQQSPVAGVARGHAVPHRRTPRHAGPRRVRGGGMTSFVVACPAADVPVGTAKRVNVDGTVVAIVHADEGYFAINDRCSHADVSLADGEVDGCAIECWLHGSAFDLRTGVPVSLPAIEPVPTYAVRIVGEADDAIIEIDPTPIRSGMHAPGA